MKKTLTHLLLAAAFLLAAGGIKATAQTTWPEDPGAFDYGVAAGVTKTAKITTDLLEEWGVAKGERLPSPAISVDNITWLSGEKNSGTYQGNRIVYNRVKSREVVAGVKVPSDIGIRFKINRPGSFSMYPRFMYAEDERAQKFIAVLVTKKGGVESATQIFEETKPAENMSTSGREQADKKYRIEFEVTSEMLSGIDEAATVYFWHAADNPDNIGHMVSYFPPKWTPAL